jgi:hypothetical protein
MWWNFCPEFSERKYFPQPRSTPLRSSTTHPSCSSQGASRFAHCHGYELIREVVHAAHLRELVVLSQVPQNSGDCVLARVPGSVNTVATKGIPGRGSC